MNDRQFLLRVPSIGIFLLEDGERIAVDIAPGTGPQDVAAIVGGIVFGILLHHRRCVVLRASAVAVNGRAVLFCAASTKGKSTLAAALAGHGYPIVSDDQCVITLDETGHAQVTGDGTSLRLWLNAMQHLQLEPRPEARLRPALLKFIEPTGPAIDAPLPIGAVYALAEERRNSKISIVAVDPGKAAIAFTEAAYRPPLVGHFRQGAAYFRVSGAIAKTAGFHMLRRPLRYDTIPAVISVLEAHWSDTGLKGAVS